MSRCVLILSGGQDSTTCLFWAKERFSRVDTITFTYGQRHAIEVDAAVRIAALAGVSSKVVDLSDVLVAKSSLTDASADLPTGGSSGIPSTFVPLRNAVFINIAANYAHSIGATAVVTGVSESDGAGYPDCRSSFISAQEEALSLALGSNFAIFAPLMDLTKQETVRLAATLDGCWEALALSVTCYAGERGGCGRCQACQLRARGFALAGLDDPAGDHGSSAATPSDDL